jgi:hypothetical protein
MWRQSAGALLLSLAVASCRYQATPVSLVGSPSDIAALAGEWIGEYSSLDSRRSGSITLTVVAGSDSAHGDVVMFSSGAAAVVAADVESRIHAGHSMAPDILRISFVRVFGGMVAGELEPYVAPDCRCVVRTVFQGTVKRNTIDGEYYTRSDGGLRQQGRWSAWRKTIAAR